MSLYLSIAGQRLALDRRHAAAEVVGALSQVGPVRMNLYLANGGSVTINVSSPCEWALEDIP